LQGVSASGDGVAVCRTSCCIRHNCMCHCVTRRAHGTAKAQSGGAALSAQALGGTASFDEQQWPPEAVSHEDPTRPLLGGPQVRCKPPRGPGRLAGVVRTSIHSRSCTDAAALGCGKPQANTGLCSVTLGAGHLRRLHCLCPALRHYAVLSDSTPGFTCCLARAPRGALRGRGCVGEVLSASGCRPAGHLHRNAPAVERTATAEPQAARTRPGHAWPLCLSPAAEPRHASLASEPVSKAVGE